MDKYLRQARQQAVRHLMLPHLAHGLRPWAPCRLIRNPDRNVIEPDAHAGKEPKTGTVNDVLDEFRDRTWDTIDPVKKLRPVNE